MIRWNTFEECWMARATYGESYHRVSENEANILFMSGWRFV